MNTAGTERLGKARRGMQWHGTAGKARQSKAALLSARRGMA